MPYGRMAYDRLAGINFERMREYRLQRTKEAMDYFWQIDEAYVRGRYSLCRDLIAVLEDTSSGEAPLKSYLPQESYTDNGRFSPADRYQEIWDALCDTEKAVSQLPHGMAGHLRRPGFT